MQYIGYGSLKERAAAEIRSAIVRGDLEPGTAIKDVELAEKLGLSRTPVREALATLTDEGLVETKPHAYTRVTALEAEPVRDALVVVQAMHALAIGLAVPLVARWYLEDLGWTAAVGVVAVAVTGVAVTRWFGSSLTAVRFALLALVLLVLFRWVLP